MTLASHNHSKLLAIPQLSLALSSSCDRRLAVDGVSLELRREQIMCVVGKSGSGQSLSLADLAPANRPEVLDGALLALDRSQGLHWARFKRCGGTELIEKQNAEQGLMSVDEMKQDSTAKPMRTAIWSRVSGTRAS